MGGVPLLLAIATLGVDYGWQPVASGGVEYIVQIPPDQLDQLQRIGGDITSTVDPSIRGRIHRVVIRVGDGELPRDAGPQPARDDVAQAAATSEIAAKDADQVPIPSLDAEADRLAMNLAPPGAGDGASASVMRPAADDASAGSTFGRTTPDAENRGYAYPAATGAASEPPSSANVPPFTGPSTDPVNRGAAPAQRDTRWEHATALRSGAPSTEPRANPPSADPAPRTDPRSDPRQDPRTLDPRTDPRLATSNAPDPRNDSRAAPSTASDPRSQSTWATPPAGSGNNNPAGTDPRNVSPGPQTAQGVPTNYGQNNGAANNGSASSGPFGAGGFGVPPVGYTDHSGGRPAEAPQQNNGYSNPTAGVPGDYRGTQQPDAQTPYAGRTAQPPYAYTYQADANRGWDPATGNYQGPAGAAPPMQQPAYDPRPPAAYPYHPIAQRTDAAQSPLGLPTPAPAAPPPQTASTLPTAGPAASASDAGNEQASSSRNGGAIPRGSLIDRSDERLDAEPPALAFQKVFNGMLLLSLVANTYLLITLSRLLQRYRNIVSNVRATAPHPSATT